MIRLDLAGSYPSWLTDPLAGAWRAVVESWPLPAFAAAALAGMALAARIAYLRAWRSALVWSYWVRIDPPASSGPLPAGHVWRLLAPLAELAHGRWRIVRLPLAFEIHAHSGHLRAYLRVPAHVPPPVAIKKAAQAWPGAAVTVAAPVGVFAARPGMAGYWLASRDPDTRPTGRRPAGPGRARRPRV